LNAEAKPGGVLGRDWPTAERLLREAGWRVTVAWTGERRPGSVVRVVRERYHDDGRAEVVCADFPPPVWTHAGER
jgi:hypothetical protein